MAKQEGFNASQFYVRKVLKQIDIPDNKSINILSIYPLYHPILG